MYHTILTSFSWYDITNYLWGVFLIPYGSWSANQLMHNISVRMWISWYVLQPIHNICVRICVRLCHRMSCDGPLIEQSLVTFVITTRLITSKIDGTFNKTSLHVKTSTLGPGPHRRWGAQVRHGALALSGSPPIAAPHPTGWLVTEPTDPQQAFQGVGRSRATPPLTEASEGAGAPMAFMEAGRW